MSKLHLNIKNEGFSVKVLDNVIKFFIKERNIDNSSFRDIEIYDRIEKFLLVRDRESSSWNPGGTDYFLLEDCELFKIDTNLQDVDGRIYEYHILYEKGTSLTNFEYTILLKQLKIENLEDE